MLTWGEISLIQQEIADRWVHVNERILCLNSGTGKQAFLHAKGGGNTLCLDHCSRLLKHITHKKNEENLSLFIQPVQAEINNISTLFHENSFDIIIASLLMGKLQEAEQIKLLKDCWNILKPDGTFIIVEKFAPHNRITKYCMNIIEAPIKLLVFMFTGFMIKPINTLDSFLKNAQFEIYEKRDFFFTTLKIIFSQKKQ